MKERLSGFLRHINKIGGKTKPLIFEPPASFDDVHEIEQTLKYTLPEEFKKTLLSISSHCEFRWFLPNSFELPSELRQIFCGELHWGMDFIVQFNKDKDDWVKDVFPNVTDEYDKVWHNKFVFQEVGNGDFVSIDLAPASLGKIVYLSHDDGEGHGYTMANSFSELLNNWIQLGCVGAEDWQWLPFCESKTSCIDPLCENAKLWYKALGI
jgi:cell wall assembly regulator SMI1